MAPLLAWTRRQQQWRASPLQETGPPEAPWIFASTPRKPAFLILGRLSAEVNRVDMHARVV